MPPVPQVAQQISQEQNQQQNGPNLSSLHSSLPAPQSGNPAFLQQVQPAGCDKQHVILVPTPVPVQQQVPDLHIILYAALNSWVLCIVIAVVIYSAPFNSLSEYWEEIFLRNSAVTSVSLRKSRQD